MYTCPCCKTEWDLQELATEYSLVSYEDREGCPDCLHECERCGDLIDSHGTFEHCL